MKVCLLHPTTGQLSLSKDKWTSPTFSTLKRYEAVVTEREPYVFNHYTKLIQEEPIMNEKA